MKTRKESALFLSVGLLMYLLAAPLQAAVVFDDSFADGDLETHRAELEKMRDMSAYAASLGLEVHAGHGLTYTHTNEILRIIRANLPGPR